MKRLIYIFLAFTVAFSFIMEAQQKVTPSSGGQQKVNPSSGQQKKVDPSPVQTKRTPRGAVTKGAAGAAGTATGAEATFSGQPEQTLQGSIVSLEDVLLGNARSLSAEQAESLFNQNRPLAFMSGEQVYIVVNDDFTIASDKLYLHAKSDTITVTGETLSKGGMTFIRASDITSEPTNQ